ncbi:hypothetical protein [Glycomyces rhizosphaerae]|uniref:DUF3558 domain-containing protein n=1 Tax=Glycomyces rhizosphaerae TaxID=2054422 RepID=A0ABV7Q1A0_9ACTN
MRPKFAVGAVAVFMATVSLFGCTAEESPDGEAVDPETAEPTTVAEATPPELQRFDDRAAALSEFDGACPALNFEPLLGEFANAGTVDYTSTSYPDEPDTAWTGTCTVFVEPEEGPGFDPVHAVIDVFDTNVLAFEHYQDSAKGTAESFSDAPIDTELQLESGSPWHDSRITAQETPTNQTAQRSMATAVLLGDFYTVEILVRFEPGEVFEAGCEPAGTAECAMTATSMAEFLATSGYLDELHASIEAAIDGGM